jgi:hypothetical protein
MANQQQGLVKQQISISLTGGIDRKTDPKQLVNGQMYTADNVQYVTEKQCRKRFGYMALNPPGGLQGTPFTAVGCRDNVEPVILGNGTLNRYNTQTGLSTFLNAPTQGRLDAIPITASSGKGTLASPPTDASAATDGQKYIFVTWQETLGNTANLFYGVQDISTGAWIISPQYVPLTALNFASVGYTGYTLVTYCSPQAFYYNGAFYLFTTAIGVKNGTYAQVVVAFALPLNNLASGLTQTNFHMELASGGTIQPNVNLPLGWDGQFTNQYFYAAQQTSNGSGTVNVYTLPINNTSIVLINLFNYTGAASSASNYYYISMSASGPASTPYAIATPSSLLILDSNGTQVSRTDFNNPILANTTVTWNGNTAYALSVVANGQTYSVQCTAVTMSGTTVASTVRTLVPSPQTSLSVGILSRIAIWNNRLYFWQFTSGYAGPGVYRAQVLTEFDPVSRMTRHIARTAYQSAAIDRGSQIQGSNILQIPGTKQFVTFLAQTTDFVDGKPGTLTANPVYATQYYGSLQRVTFDFTPKQLPLILNMPTGGNFIAGAFPVQYDGQSISEAGYSVAPEFIGNSLSFTSSSTGGNVGPGTFTYYACFVRRDAYGNVIRSAPSNAALLTLTGSTNSVTFPPINYVNGTNVYIEYYRTTTATPSEPYYLGKVAVGQPFTDTLSDAAIVTNFNMYTFSGEFPNDPPPAVHHMAIGETRAYIIPSDSRNAIWCSKKFSPGRTIEWTSNLILSEGGTHGGLFTAIAVLDTNVIVFKQDQILYFYGDGPDNTGASGSFSAFQRLSSDVGCIDPGSIAVIPGGLLFRSQRGIELLTRGLQVQYIGAPIEPIVQAIDTISSTCVLPQYQQVRFISNVPGDPVLVFDYINNRWSTYSNMSALACSNVRGNYWWISQDGSTCNVETPNVFTDNGAFITMTLETPEIPMIGIQGWGRLYRLGVLGEYKTPHTLTTSLAYDHAETYTDNVYYSVMDTGYAQIFDPGTVFYDSHTNIKADSVTAPCAEQFRLSRVPRQVMQTVRIMLQDMPFSGYYMSDGSRAPITVQPDECCAISNITLEVGQKAILAKLPGSKTV